MYMQLQARRNANVEDVDVDTLAKHIKSSGCRYVLTRSMMSGA